MDKIHLNYVLDCFLREKEKRTCQLEFLSDLVTQMCVAIGNRKVYDKCRDQSSETKYKLHQLEWHLQDTPKKEDAAMALIRQWEETFGDPDEAVAKYDAALAAQKRKVEVEEPYREQIRRQIKKKMGQAPKVANTANNK
jgi:hypothetical protein